MDLFPSVLGHDTVKRHLFSAALSDSVSHAYIFEGVAGIGRHTMANALAQTLLCTENRDAQGHIVRCACGSCVACQTVLSGNHPDIVRVGIPKDKAAIPVDSIRDVNREIANRPYYNGKKIVIISDADKMNAAAQNALLKTLEEPPAYAVIILIANSAAQLLSTVESRSVKITFQPLPFELIKKELEKRGFSEAQVALGTTFSGGSLGAALRACADETFDDMRRDIYSLLAQAPDRSASWLLGQEASLETYKKDFNRFLSLCETWYRDVLIAQTKGDDAPLLNADFRTEIEHCAAAYSASALAGIIWRISDLREKLDQSVNFALSMDNLLLSLEAK